MNDELKLTNTAVMFFRTVQFLAGTLVGRRWASGDPRSPPTLALAGALHSSAASTDALELTRCRRKLRGHLCTPAPLLFELALLHRALGRLAERGQVRRAQGAELVAQVRHRLLPLLFVEY